MRAKSQLVLRDDPYEHDGDCMEFRLTYEGPLSPSFNNSSPTKEKHEIRQKFHPQLARLWETNPFLKEMKYPYRFPDVKGPVSWASGDSGVSRVEYLAKNFSRNNYRFVPLVTEDLSLWCGLDILFLRSSPPGKLFNAGDIDNRIKTLFDALKTPKKLEELGGYDQPSMGENPFFCLLEDDALVAKLTVETDTLLEPIVGGIPHEKDSRVVITVRLRPLTFKWENMGFV